MPPARLVASSLALLPWLLAGCGDSAPGSGAAVPAATASGAGSAETASAETIAANVVAAGVAAGPRIEFDVTSHDFGRISDVASTSFDFVFRNAGTGTLEIKDVKPNCGCTVTTLDKKRFAPGESDSIAVTFSPKGHGRQIKQIKVLTNSVDRPVVQLAISAEIVPLAQAEPQYLRLGARQFGVEHESIVTLDSLDPDLVVERVTSSSPSIRAEHLPRDGDLPHRIRVTIPATAPWGPIGGRVMVAVRGRPFPDRDPVDHTTEVYVNAQLYDAVRIAQNPMLVSRIDPGATIDYTTRISHAEGKPFMIFDARLEAEVFDGVSVTVQPVGGVRPAAAYDVHLGGMTGRYIGLVRGSVVLETDLPGAESQMRLKYMGSVRQATN